MAEYIDIDAPIDFAVYERNIRITATFRQFLEINDAKYQAADVVPVRHGKWVKATGMMPPEYCGLHICSECGHYAGKKPPYGGREMLSDYCPRCGADMRGEQT